MKCGRLGSIRIGHMFTGLLTALFLMGCDGQGSAPTPVDRGSGPRMGGGLDAQPIPTVPVDAGLGLTDAQQPDAALVDATAPADAEPADARPPSRGTAGLTGTVWAPANAPGQAPPGHEIPVAGALVNLTAQRMSPIPAGSYCERCIPTPPTAVLTDTRGRFEIVDHPEGEFWLTIQKGQFRVERMVRLEAGQMLEVPTPVSTMPSRHAPENGRWTPRIALALGSYDSLEDVFGKIGFGTVDDTGEFVGGSADAAAFNIDYYDNGGSTLDQPVVGTLEDLVRDRERLRGYHIIFIPCSGSSHTDALDDDVVRRNLRDYVARGGKLFVTDWSGEWHDNIFPTQVELGRDEDTPAGAFDMLTDMWSPELFGDADGSPYDTPNAEAVDADLAAWLGAQSGPHLDGPDGRYDARSFFVQGNWNIIDGLHEVELGLNREGQLEIDQPKTWVIGGSASAPEPKKPLTVTYEPAGCGRVLYSTYHTADDIHVGLVPQERILVYLIMEVGACRDPKLF